MDSTLSEEPSGAPARPPHPQVAPMSSRMGGHGWLWEGRRGAGGGGEDTEDVADEVAFERADGFAGALAFLAAPGEVFAGRRVDAGLGERDDVDGAVQAPVAAAVESVAPAFA